MSGSSLADEAVIQQAMRRDAAVEAGRSSALGSLRGLGSVQSLFPTVAGAPAPAVTLPEVVAVARRPQASPPPVPGMPRDGGTNLLGVVRDPRATGVTPAGVRFADPGWMRQAPSERR